MSYLKKNKLWIGVFFAGVLTYHGYFICLLHMSYTNFIYIDLLIGIALILFVGLDVYQYYKNLSYKKELLCRDYVIFRELKTQEDIEIAEHDVHVLESQLREQFDMNCDLQDYIAKWCHEVKLPLSASMLMNEKITDVSLRASQKEQLEAIRQRLNGALLGCKVQSSLFDLQVHAANLSECVKTAIHNNQYFLIQKQFTIDLQVESIKIYTDPSWFVYVLDQIIQNAVKYCTESPRLVIQSMQENEGIVLVLEDNGEGILESDIRRIFERGYTGSNHHNGKYKSTGMGLYLAAQIIERLGHTIAVESEYGTYTRFLIGI